MGVAPTLRLTVSDQFVALPILLCGPSTMIRSTSLPAASVPVPPLQPRKWVASRLAYCTGVGPVAVCTRTAPAAGKPVVLATAMLLVGSATPSEPAATVVEVFDRLRVPPPDGIWKVVLTKPPRRSGRRHCRRPASRRCIRDPRRGRGRARGCGGRPGAAPSPGRRRPGGPRRSPCRGSAARRRRPRSAEPRSAGPGTPCSASVEPHHQFLQEREPVRGARCPAGRVDDQVVDDADIHGGDRARLRGATPDGVGERRGQPPRRVDDPGAEPGRVAPLGRRRPELEVELELPELV